MERLQSEIHVSVRDKVIGGPDLLICLPLVAQRKSALLDQAAELARLNPDLFEWRIDGYSNASDVHDSLQTLKELRKVIGDIPLIFTCRIAAEGGFKKIPRKIRMKLITEAVQSGAPDIVDVELCNDSDFIHTVQKSVAGSGQKLILSYHNFNQTPNEAFIVSKLEQARGMGADIAKVAVMPQTPRDVLTLLSATLKARTHDLKIPMITMSLGPEGRITRLAGGLFGTDITFAMGEAASAPGQIRIQTLRQAMAALYT